MEHFENVCIDLKNALVREEDLQKLFDQNILQIKEMEKRYDMNFLPSIIKTSFKPLVSILTNCIITCVDNGGKGLILKTENLNTY